MAILEQSNASFYKSDVSCCEMGKPSCTYIDWQHHSRVLMLGSAVHYGLLFLLIKPFWQHHSTVCEYNALWSCLFFVNSNHSHNGNMVKDKHAKAVAFMANMKFTDCCKGYDAG